MISRRTVLKGVAAGAVASAGLAMPAIGQSKPDRLIVPDGGGIIRDAYKKAHYDTFEAKTGIKIVPAEYMGISQLKALVENKAWSQADVLSISSGEAAIAARQGLVERLDYGNIDKTKLIPQTVNDHYMLTSLSASVVAWNTSKFNKDTAPKDWKDVFDPSKFKGRRGMWKNASLTMDIAALGSGIPADKLYPLNIDAAINALKGLGDDLVFWEHGAQCAQMLSDNEVDFEFGWAGRLFNPRKNGEPVDYHFHQAVLDGDASVIPLGSPNRKWAQMFIDHMTDAKDQAELSKVAPYAPTNTDASKYLTAEELAALPTGPGNFPSVVFQDAGWWADNGQAAFDAFNKFLLG